MARKPKHTAYSLENGRSYAELRTFTRTVTAQGSLTDAEENPNAIALPEPPTNTQLTIAFRSLKKALNKHFDDHRYAI